MKKLHTMTVKGNKKNYCFEVLVDPQYVEEWRADGIEIYELVNTIPEWVVDIGMLKTWCFVQDVFNFKNPFK
jgi:hypothetical protein